MADDELKSFQETTGRTGLLQEGGQKSGALGAREALLEADLAGWLDACPVALSDDIKAGILAMVRTVGGMVDCKGEPDTGSLVTSLTAATCEG